MWGVVDVNDSAEAMKLLSAQGLIDAKRTAIRGSSAGLQTELCFRLPISTFFTVTRWIYGAYDTRRQA